LPLGFANRTEFAALAYTNDSGSCSKRRMTMLADPIVNCEAYALYLRITAIVSKNLLLQTVFKVKPKMLAIVAVIHKLLIIINNRRKDFYSHCSFSS
jgi:hypothetical protein